MKDISLRRRRPKPRRPQRARDLAVLAFPADEHGPTLVFGPYTKQGAQAVGLRELNNGRKVQMVPYARVLAMSEVR
jgi:hypothetical protein